MALLFLAHCGQDVTHLASRPSVAQAEIVGGDRTEHPAAVGMIGIMSAERLLRSCTGTVIAPHTMLTAAHCILDFDATGQPQPRFVASSGLRIYMGSRVKNIAAAPFYGVRDVVFPEVDGRMLEAEDFWADLLQHRPFDNDIALIHVNTPFAQQPLALASRAPQVGDGLLLIGYGSTGEASNHFDVGTRRRTYARIYSTFEQSRFVAGNRAHSACVGDSGGPALFGDQVVGIVHSAMIGKGGSCLGDNVFIRTDAWRSFIADNSY